MSGKQAQEELDKFHITVNKNTVPNEKRGPTQASGIRIGTPAMGVAGDLAEERRLQNGTGNATFRTDLIDAVFNLTEEQLNGGVRYEVYEG